VVFTQAAPNGPTIKTRLPFEVRQQGEDRIVRLSYKPKKIEPGRQTSEAEEMKKAAEDAAHSMLGVGFHMPSLQDRRLGWGKTELKIAYSPSTSRYRNLVPLVGDAREGDRIPVVKIPLEIILLFNADRNDIITTPEATVAAYNIRSWDASSGQRQIFQAVIVDKTLRWWVDHAPDVLFLIIGIFLGDWLAKKESWRPGSASRT
jgi:hypothetical protein